MSGEKRRRWSNELLDSLMDFQNKEETQQTSVGYVENILTTAPKISKTLEDPRTPKTPQSVSLDSTVIMTDSGNESEKSSSDLINFSGNEKIMKNQKLVINLSKENMEHPNTETILSNFNSQNSTDIQSYYSSAKNSSQSSLQSNLNERLTENSQVSTDSEALKFFSCTSTSHSSNDDQFCKSCKNKKLPLDAGQVNLCCCACGTDKYSLNYSSPQSKAEKKLSNEVSCEGQFFSSPIKFSSNNLPMINDMNEPDMWKALLELEQELIPEDNTKEKINDPFLVLTRLSAKFKETPTKFTEKLVSIIEDSIISIESPTKQAASDTSGISLHRITGEFRKLCKFIEDESMPDLAPSLYNTFVEKTEQQATTEYEKCKDSGTPTNKFKILCQKTPQNNLGTKGLRDLITPKNKIRSNQGTPINKFTPSADKSFEYWESVCNMICENKDSVKKQRRISFTETSKQSMYDMLTICERQLASLDDSMVDIRCSEPYKKTESDIYLKNNMTPRSNSISKFFSSPKNKVKHSFRKQEKLINDDFEINIHKTFDDKKDKKYSIELLNQDKNIIFNQSQSFNKSDLMTDQPSMSEEVSPFGTASRTMAGSYISDDQDCSLLIELANRRQRILETAKLMMEIDREDPTITEDNNKCLKTLYKLGIQDEGIPDVEDDAKFLNTLSECVDYGNYFRNNSKPICSIIQNFDTPGNIEKKVLLMRKSKNLNDSKKPIKSISKNMNAKFNKPSLDPRSSIKKTMPEPTKRFDLKALSKSVPRLNGMPKKTPNPVKTTSKIVPQMNRKNLNKKNLLSEFELEKNNSSKILLSKTPLRNQKTDSKKKASEAASKIIIQNKLANEKNQPFKRKAISENQKQKEKKTSTPQAHTLLKQEPSKFQDISQIKMASKSTPNVLSSKLPLELKEKKKSLTREEEIPKYVADEFSILEDSLTVVETLETIQKLSLLSINPVEQEQEDIKIFCLKSTSPHLMVHESQIHQDSFLKKLTPNTTYKCSSEMTVSTETDKIKFSVLREKSENENYKTPIKTKLFFSPGKTPISSTVSRKKPTSYFSDADVEKKAPIKNLMAFDSVNSPIRLYVNGTDPHMVQNISLETNEWFLTPIDTQKDGTPKLKINLPAKENQSPKIDCINLPFLRYESTPKKHVLVPDKSYSPSLIAPNSRKNLLGEVENTLVVQHKGRIIDPVLDTSRADTSVLVQKIAHKTPINRKRFL